MDDKMIERISWNEFIDNGFLWLINQQLHIFGLSIAIDIDENNVEKILDVYPVRTLFRGFDASSNTNGYRKITEYFIKNSDFIKDAFITHIYITKSDSFKSILKILTDQLTKSNSEAKRLLFQGAVFLNNEKYDTKIFDPVQFKNGDTLKVGKKIYKIQIINQDITEE